MPGRGKDADRSPKPSRVLEAVLERYEAVARTPDEEGRAADAIEVWARVVSEEGAGRALNVGVLRGAFEEADDGVRLERSAFAAPQSPKGSQRSRGRRAKLPRKRVITWAGRIAAR